MAIWEFLGSWSAITAWLYHFNGNPNDSSGNWLNWSTTNVVYGDWINWSASASFNGSSSFMTLPQSTKFDVTTWTFAVKFKQNTLMTNGENRYIFDHWDETTWSGAYAWFGFGIYKNSSWFFSVSVVISNGTSWNTTYHDWVSGFSDDLKTHTLVVTLTGTTTKIYFDWELKSTKTNHSNVNYSTNPTIYVGCYHREYGGSNIALFNGLFDELVVENILWDDSKIRKFHTNSIGRFCTF